MFLEMTAAMAKYWSDDKIVPFVVSKTGKMGRSHLTDSGFASSYGVDPKVYNYDTFQHVADKQKDIVVFHHVLGHTRPIRFHPSCKYIVINHTMTNIRRLTKFRPFHELVSVCNYFAHNVRMSNRMATATVLNRIDDNYEERESKKGPFVVGRCQRIVPSKFADISFKAKMFPRGIKQVVVGPISSGRVSHTTSNDNLPPMLKSIDALPGPIFDRNEKLRQMREFDVYLHNTRSPEGASMAVLEALSCGVPVIANAIKGGINDLVKSGINGYFFRSPKHLALILRNLQERGAMEKLKKSVRKDFLKRLHIKISLKEYRNIING